jgi:hypothetical protein
MYELYGYEKKIYSPEKAHESGYRPLEKGSSHHAGVAIFFLTMAIPMKIWWPKHHQ